MTQDTPALTEWLRERCAAYELDVAAVYRRGGDHAWPLVAHDEDELHALLDEGGHLLPLPKEPAALANVLEVLLVDFVLQGLEGLDDVTALRGTERGYPDIEIGGARFGGHHAVDVKVARRAGNGRATQSRITLYTGNSYFKYPQLRWPGSLRPFDEYVGHLDLLAVYTLDESRRERITDLELIVHEPWRIASRQRSSTTREYLGAVTDLEALRAGRGEFDSPEAFYRFWRAYPFRVSQQVANTLARLLRDRPQNPA